MSKLKRTRQLLFLSALAMEIAYYESENVQLRVFVAYTEANEN